MIISLRKLNDNSYKKSYFWDAPLWIKKNVGKKKMELHKDAVSSFQQTLEETSDKTAVYSDKTCMLMFWSQDCSGHKTVGIESKNLHQLCFDPGCHLEDFQRAMADRDE